MLLEVEEYRLAHCWTIPTTNTELSFKFTSLQPRQPFEMKMVFEYFFRSILDKQARKSSEDAQAGGYARYKFVWAG